MTRRLVLLVGVLGVAGAIGAGAYRLLAQGQGLAAEGPEVPTAKVVRGPVDTSVHTTGELRASSSKTLMAPAVGGMLRLVTLLDTGTEVHQGDVVMEFDPVEQRYALEQAQSELEQADQTIAQLKANALAQAAQDQVTLLTAQFDVRRAQLDVLGDPSLYAANDIAKRRLALDEAQKHLAQVEADVKSRGDTNRATLAASEAGRAKSQMAADRAQRNIDSLVVKAPMDGFVAIRENQDAAGGIFFSGMVLPEFRAGDNVYPGRPVADLYDIAQMEIRAKVDEQDRNNVAPGQAAAVQSDAVPGVPLTAKVTGVSGSTGGGGFFGSSGPLRQFDVTLKLDPTGVRLYPGTTVHLTISGTRLTDVLSVPGQAVFEQAGKPIVYLRQNGRFETQPVQVVRRTEDRVVITGLAEGAEVALVDPATVSATSGSPGSTLASGAAPARGRS